MPMQPLPPKAELWGAVPEGSTPPAHMTEENTLEFVVYGRRPDPELPADLVWVGTRMKHGSAAECAPIAGEGLLLTRAQWEALAAIILAGDPVDEDGEDA